MSQPWGPGGRAFQAEGTASAEAPRENKLQWGKGPGEEGPGTVTQKAGVAWPQALGAGFAPPSHRGSSASSWLLRGQPCLSPWALCGFTASQLCDPKAGGFPSLCFCSSLPHPSPGLRRPPAWGWGTLWAHGCCADVRWSTSPGRDGRGSQRSWARPQVLENVAPGLRETQRLRTESEGNAETKDRVRQRDGLPSKLRWRPRGRHRAGETGWVKSETLQRDRETWAI